VGGGEKDAVGQFDRRFFGRRGVGFFGAAEYADDGDQADHSQKMDECSFHGITS
jgi:hypothetical protein